MTRYTATFTVGDASASAPFIVADGHGSLVGAEIIPGDDEDMDDAIADFEILTGRALVVRRHQYGSDVPLVALDSDIGHDQGKARKSLVTFQPGRGTLPSTLGLFLSQCEDLGLVVDVALWPEPHRYMPPLQYQVLCELYVPVIHEFGFTHTFCASNYAAVMDDALEAYWPGGDLADSVGMVYYPSGLSLSKAADFAAAHGKPLGLAEFGVDADATSETDAAGFLDYIEDFFASWISQGQLVSDLIWRSGYCGDDGDFRLRRDPVFVRFYQEMFDTLIT